MKWFRVYNEILDDPKVSKMDGETFKIFIFLLALASEQEKNGKICMSVGDISWRIRIPKKRLLVSISYMENNGIIKTDSETSIILVNWEKRQFSSDNVGERVKRYREKQSNVVCNVTRNVVDTEQIQNRTDTYKPPIPLTGDGEVKIENKKGASSPFVKPTLDEIRAYCAERGNTVNPQTWLDHYTSNGWKVGKAKMVDWRAAVRTWEASRNGTSKIGGVKISA